MAIVRRFTRGWPMEFSKAQRELDSLMMKHRDHLIVERRAQEINQLIIDCMKRQRVGD